MTVHTLYFGKQYLFAVEGKAGKSEDGIGENIRFTKISYFHHVYFTFSRFYWVAGFTQW